jgi:hypothetical protein
MNLDQLLTDALHDDRLALPVPADTLEQVRRMRRRRQALGVTGISLSVVAVVAASVTLAPSGSHRTATVGSTPSAVAAGCDAPAAGQLEGSSYVIRSASDWFMTRAQSDAFFHSYNEPSPKPEDTVPSPQPSGPGTDRLVAALTAAGVPGADTLDRDEADSGQRGALELHGTLPDGRELQVSQSRTLFPFTISGYYGSDTHDSSKDVVIENVPGTRCAALLLDPKPGGSNSAVVQVLTPDGVSTGWGSPTIALAQLRAWAFAAQRWLDEHPA